MGACGVVAHGSLLQAKGFPYAMADLFGRADRAAPVEGGTYVTLRLTSSMHHRFHAPADGTPMALVPVAAILVASIRLHFLDVLLHLRWPGPNEMPCNARVLKGEELGWFEHGSTIIVLVPPGFVLAAGIQPGQHLSQGQALLRRTSLPGL